MAQSRIAAISVLGLCTLTAAGFAWQQYRRAETLAAELDHARSQATQLAATADVVRFSGDNSGATSADDEDLPVDVDAEDDGTEDGREENRRGDSNRRGWNARLEELLKDPELAAAFQIQQRARLDGRYASLFAKLNLPPAQLTALKDLLAEKDAAPRDVFSAARAEGMGRDDREEIRALIELTREEIDADIRATIGEEAFNELNHYEKTATQRNLVDQLADRLSYSATELNTGQAETLINILAETTAGAGDNFPFGGDRRGAHITDEALARAQGVLAPDQLQVLTELKAEQEAARAIGQAMRAQFQRGGGGGGNGRGGGGGGG